MSGGPTRALSLIAESILIIGTLISVIVGGLSAVTQNWLIVGGAVIGLLSSLMLWAYFGTIAEISTNLQVLRKSAQKQERQAKDNE